MGSGGYNPENDVFATDDELQGLYTMGKDALICYGGCNIADVELWGLRVEQRTDKTDGVAVTSEAIAYRAALNVSRLQRLGRQVLGVGDEDSITALYRTPYQAADLTSEHLLWSNNAATHGANLNLLLPARSDGLAITYMLFFYPDDGGVWYGQRYEYKVHGEKAGDRAPTAMKKLEVLALTDVIKVWIDSQPTQMPPKQRRPWTTE